MGTILEEAAIIVDGDREKTYGDPAKNLNTIADLWTTWLQAKGVIRGNEIILADDVCVMMSLLKVARLANDQTHRDSQVDVCGYMRLLERIQSN